MSKEAFRDRYGENPRKDDLTILLPRQDDPTEQARGRGRQCGRVRTTVPCGWRLNVRRPPGLGAGLGSRPIAHCQEGSCTAPRTQC